MKKKLTLVDLNKHLFGILFCIPLFGNLQIINTNLFLIVILGVIFLFTLSSILFTGQIPVISRRKKSILLFLFFWLIYSIVSTAWVVDYSSFFVVFTNLLLLFLIVLLYFYNNFNIMDLSCSLRYLTLPILFHIINGINEIVTQRYFFTDNIYISGYIRNRLPVSSLFNTNNYATVLCFFITIIIFLFLIENKKLYKVIYSILLLIMLYLVFMTQSRANIIASTLVIVIVYFLYKFTKKITVLDYFLIITFLLGILFLIVKIYDNSSVYIETYTNSMFNSVQSNSDRVNLLKNGMILFKRSYGLGVGLGNVEYNMMMFSVFPTNNVYNLHNFFAEILVSSGIILFAMIVFNYINMMLKSVRGLTVKNNLLKMGNIVFIAYMSGFIFSGVSTSNLFQLRWFWLIFAIILILYSQLDKEKKINLAFKGVE